jgi:hypothetical protein
MNERATSSPCHMRGVRARSVEAAGAVDAQNAPTNSLENAQNAFPTATTDSNNVLPMSSDKTVTYVLGCPTFGLQAPTFGLRVRLKPKAGRPKPHRPGAR